MSHQPRVEIVPSMVGTFETMGKEFRVSADTDSIIRFVEPRFDYLRYLDLEEGCMTIVHLGQASLATLVEFGLPETRQRLKMSEDEFNAWLQWEETYDMQQFEEELTDIEDL